MSTPHTDVGQRARAIPPAAFFLLHVCPAWPAGVVALALGSSLVKAGVPVHQTAAIIAASTLAYTLEFVWAPLVDSCLTRRRWYIAGAAAMCGSLVALLIAPWNAESVPYLMLLAFISSSGAGVTGVAVKGIMAYDVPTAKLGSASGYYTAGGTFAKALGGAGTLWLLTHFSGRSSAVSLSIGATVLASTMILLASPAPPPPWRDLPQKLRFALLDLWNFVRTRQGALIALLCVIPFGAGTEAGLIGAIAREWNVTANQLAGLSILGSATGIAGAVFAGWFSTRAGPWKTYVILGWIMIAAMIGLAFAPRAALYFLVIELFYRALASGCYAALLGIVMTAIGRGAASTKAAGMWSLANFAVAYPALLEGAIHDSAGTRAMLMTDAGLGAVGFVVLFLALRLLRLRPASPIASVTPAVRDLASPRH
jgi:predicted MFS family arabinose efflux permease